MRIAKKLIVIWCLFLSFSLFAGGASEPDFAIFFKADISSGEPIFYKISASSKISNASATLINSKGKIIARSTPFDYKNRRKNLYGFFGLSTYAKGDYVLRVTATVKETEITKETTVQIAEREFVEFSFKIGKSNSTLLSTPDQKKQEQSDRLYKTYTTFNPTSFWQKEPFIKPVASERITSRFGDRRTNIYSTGKKTQSVHYGTDFGVPANTDVLACGAGRVVLSEFRIVTGGTVVIEHLPGLFCLYYHLNEQLVEVGDFVKQGDVIAKSGSTGFSTGPHLHWEIRANGEAVDPFFFTKPFFPE